ncbi:MAG: alpha-L-fucosidase [Fimbriimonadia bacterium]|nr:alpha-L-fucosidase [Fimbriimonadia bacterium]
MKSDIITPTEEQAQWQAMEVIAFIHFGINTFTNREWGDGKESPSLFDPSELNARQWARALKRAGCKLVILTAKHHDGFCLFQSRHTEHSVKHSPWREGKGDVVREAADACRAEGLKFGFYLSPWDRNAQNYGTPAYNAYFKDQLTELLTQYGEITEVWFDGANGEGPNGKRQEYDWQGFYQVVRRHQPKALIAISGPDIRWVGNEDGLARLDETSVQPAHPEMHPGKQKVWYPAECDVSIRPGWFYHEAEDGKVKSLDHLMKIYYQSVGRNSVLLLNVPPDKRGLLHENDVARLAEFGAEVQMRFGKSLAETKGKGAVVELDLGVLHRIDHVMIQEAIRQGERIQSWVVEGFAQEKWSKLCEGKIVGHKRIERFEPVDVSKIRLRALESLAEPIVEKLAVYSQSS